jgi:hypothetical protein
MHGVGHGSQTPWRRTQPINQACYRRCWRNGWVWILCAASTRISHSCISHSRIFRSRFFRSRSSSRISWIFILPHLVLLDIHPPTPAFPTPAPPGPSYATHFLLHHMSPPAPHRVSRSCERCSNKHRRCDGAVPCARCIKSGNDCRPRKQATKAATQEISTGHLTGTQSDGPAGLVDIQVPEKIEGDSVEDVLVELEWFAQRPSLVRELNDNLLKRIFRDWANTIRKAANCKQGTESTAHPPSDSRSPSSANKQRSRRIYDRDHNNSRK